MWTTYNNKTSYNIMMALSKKWRVIEGGIALPNHIPACRSEFQNGGKLQSTLSLRLVKSALTRAITKLEDSFKDMSKAPEETPMVNKVRLAASVIEALGLITEKSNNVSEVREKTQ